ncbi:hypothetical protein FW800_25730 [Pseudomonas sp. 910_23]|uniref:hypothetical protein n=1 Tax=Pseudomonas sp. 910_23 TaxID=2604461 RepID=UPI004062BA22
MEVTKIWCEWDIGVNECLWTTEAAAMKDVAEALTGVGIEEPIEELLSAGLLGFEQVIVRT